MGRVELYHYRYRGRVLAGWEAKAILDYCTSGFGETVAEVELGTRRARVYCSRDEICIDFGGRECFTPPEDGRLSTDAAYTIAGGELVKLATYTPRGFIKLRPLAPSKPPTLEINGIHMHRIEGIDPLSDARLKARAARVCRGCIVLDTCGGLGYTARAALERGAARIIVVEVEETVLSLAQFNPWSKHLGDKRVTLLHADIRDFIELLPDESVDRIIHDPPRISVAGELYDKTLYEQFYRVLKRRGVIYHYTGEPGRRRRLNIPRTVARKLEEAGFTRPYYHPSSQGVVAYKD